MDETNCPECRAAWHDGLTCTDHFHQMLFWESEFPALGEVHHFMVLCYHLQHPSLYSAEMMPQAMKMLEEFVSGMPPAEMRRRMRDDVDSGKRKTPITARPDSHGAYAHPVTWTMTAADVVSRGADAYVDTTRQWASSIYNSLVASGNLTPA